MANDDSDFLMISGLKHFQFCRRRWALVHIEQLWEENALTLEGHFMHERVHDDSFTEARGSVLLSRGMPVRSQELKITGVCDMVEGRERSPNSRTGWAMEAVSSRIQAWAAGYTGGRCAAAMCTGYVPGRNVCHQYSGSCSLLWKSQTPAACSPDRGIAAKGKRFCYGDATTDVKGAHAEGKDGESLQKLLSCGYLSA